MAWLRRRAPARALPRARALAAAAARALRGSMAWRDDLSDLISQLLVIVDRSSNQSSYIFVHTRHGEWR